MVAQVPPAGGPDVSFGDQENIQRIFQQILVPSKQFPDPAPNLVAMNGVPDLLAGDRSHPGMAQLVGEIDQIEIFPSGATASLVKLGEFRFLTDPFARTIALYHQTARRFLPFARRLLMTFCPPLVLMRTKKPWSFFLFLLFGLNVGFILVLPLRVVC
jgi:hypothetical protein